jgi:hypothetical protein
LMPIAIVATIGTICVVVVGRGQPRTTVVPAAGANVGTAD